MNTLMKMLFYKSKKKKLWQDYFVCIHCFALTWMTKVIFGTSRYELIDCYKSGYYD